MAIRVQRDVLAGMLRSHGEVELAELVASITEDQLARIQNLGAYYAWSVDAYELGVGMGQARALSLASVDVLDGTGRDLCQQRSDQELGLGVPEELTAEERAADRELRSHAAEKQLPSG